MSRKRWMGVGLCWIGLVGGMGGSLRAESAGDFGAEFQSVGGALRKAPLPEYPGVLDQRLRPLLRRVRASLAEGGGGPKAEATMRAVLLGAKELLAIEDVEAAMLTAYAVSAEPELVVRELRTLSEADREELAFYLFAGTSSCGEGDPRKPSLLRLEIAMAPLLDELIVRADAEAAGEANASGSPSRK